MVENIRTFVAAYMQQSEGNMIQRDFALSPELIGTVMYEVPEMGIAAAGDQYFDTCKEPHVIGPHFLKPEEWLENARSVISFFFPMTRAVCQSNEELDDIPSALWLHSRFEGQQFLQQFCRDMKEFLIRQDLDVVVPSQDQRFRASESGTYTSNWSERHIAYACGLGTFGLSRGLITRRGVAGRFCSFIISAELEPTVREYEDHEAYCSFCGCCIKRCPAGAITLEEGKDHERCAQFVHKTGEIYSPRYGCGKCQVKVPCEKGIPPARLG